MRNSKLQSRREFIKISLLGAGALVIPMPLVGKKISGKKKITFGICTDVHKDIMPDAEERLRVFINRMNKEKVDFIIQLGDFCFPKKENENFLSIWNKFDGKKYHVLGNHDMDISSKRETMEFWGMENSVYSFDAGNFHFVVLDPNFFKEAGKFVSYDDSNYYSHGNSRTYVPPEQLKWLQDDLKKTNIKSVVFSHQSFAHGCRNGEEVRAIVEEANQSSGFQKVIACVNGHHHSDRYDVIKGIHYVNINSMSYKWLGNKYAVIDRYPEEILKKYPSAKYIAPYRDPLYALVTIGSEEMKIKGMKSEFIPPTPEDLGVPSVPDRNSMIPQISNRIIKLKR